MLLRGLVPRNPTVMHFSVQTNLKLGATTGAVVAPMSLMCNSVQTMQHALNNRWLDNFAHADVGKIIGLEGVRDTVRRNTGDARARERPSSPLHA